MDEVLELFFDTELEDQDYDDIIKSIVTSKMEKSKYMKHYNCYDLIIDGNADRVSIEDVTDTSPSGRVQLDIDTFVKKIEKWRQDKEA